MTDEMLPLMGPGYDEQGNFVLTEFRVEASPLSNVTRLKSYPVAKAVADYEREDLNLPGDGRRRKDRLGRRPARPTHARRRSLRGLHAERTNRLRRRHAPQDLAGAAARQAAGPGAFPR